MRKEMAPWTGHILHIDLTKGEVSTLSSHPYVSSYLGGRGLAARLAWEMIPPGIEAFDAQNPLFFMPGALVGTPAPSSGRVTISGLSPQAWPHEWYTRANVGGHWGPALKYAGYDGLIVRGKAPHPVYIRIGDDEVELVNAQELWGQGLVASQKYLRRELGEMWRVLAIGPAGENRCRYAVIATGTESAAGQGGFGAVMGSKNLKAVAVQGLQGVAVAEPTEALRRSQNVLEALKARFGEAPITYESEIKHPERQRLAPCTYQCPGACGEFYHDMPGTVYPDRIYSGQMFCCAPRFKGGDWLGVDLGLDAGFEIAQISNDLGLNHWELTFGLVPWILRCQERGELETIDGERLDFSDPHFWVRFMENIAHREGWGDLFAEGGPRMAQALGVGEDLIDVFYPAWGQASHWDGHGSFPSPYFPYWLVTALQWAMDTRDPMGGGHGYTTNIFGLLRKLQPEAEDEELWQKIDRVGERIYGSAAAVNPWSGYEDKAIPAIFHQDRGALKDSIGICDNIFPLLTDPEAEDLLVCIDGVEGKFLEHYLFEPTSDLDLSREAFYRVGTRIFTLERLLAMRNWGRSRATDETIVPYLHHPEGAESPYLEGKGNFSPERFRALLDEYYALRGWDPESGVPLPETLRELGLEGFECSEPPNNSSVPR
ncbi:MAG: aldehyde ferredoxin oxidoreductase N-terminal domain-containing protein [Chloroflexota bacterium]